MHQLPDRGRGIGLLENPRTIPSRHRTQVAGLEGATRFKMITQRARQAEIA